jgi:enoyl-CoA hydratase/carnithine racemase
MNGDLVNRLNTLFDLRLGLLDARVIVLSGLGQRFCAGSDIVELAAMTPAMRSS